MKLLTWYGVQQTTNTTVTMKTIVVTRRIGLPPILRMLEWLAELAGELRLLSDDVQRRTVAVRLVVRLIHDVPVISTVQSVVDKYQH